MVQPSFGGLKKIRGFTCRCVHHHDAPPYDDHEIIMVVEYIPNNVELFSIPDGNRLDKGTVLSYPLTTTHGIEARYKENGGIAPYRSTTKIFVDYPICLVIEFRSP